MASSSLIHSIISDPTMLHPKVGMILHEDSLLFLFSVMVSSSMVEGPIHLALHKTHPIHEVTQEDHSSETSELWINALHEILQLVYPIS